MNALSVVKKIYENENLRNANFKYCLVTEKKVPVRFDKAMAKPNTIEDFVDLDKLSDCGELEQFAGVGISIQASNVTAIDVDKCFEIAFDLTSASDVAIDIIERFIDVAYIEFSFSGRGLRILYRQPEVSNYTDEFYTKNEKYGIEYYQPSTSYRYVTITGNTIVNNDINSKETFSDIILDFLNKYMKRQSKVIRKSQSIIEETRTLEQLMLLVKKLYMRDIIFQNRWFDTNHYLVNGLSHESQDDYQLMTMIFENITTDKEMVKQIFEQSPYFKSKDYKHVQKWKKSDFRYFYFIFDEMLRKKGITR